MRWATLVLLTLVGCTDLREFRGTWQGARVGDEGSVLWKGPGTRARLAIDRIDAHHLEGRLAVDGLLAETQIQSLKGAEADALAGLTFGGAPLRVFLAFAPVPGSGDVLVVVSLYDDHRVEVRLLRGASGELYAIFGLTEATGAASRMGTP